MTLALDEEHRLLQRTVRDFAENEIKPVAAEYNAHGTYPDDIIQKAADIGLIGVWIPEEYGGPGMGGMADALIKEETCRADPSIGFSLDTTFGGRMILLFGTDEQKEAYLPKLATGELTGSIAISEPDAGSANRYMRSRAEIVGDEYVLNGEKMWITNAPVADYLLVMARTDPTTGPGDREGISAIIVPTDIDGVEITNLDLMGLDTGRTGQVVLNDAHVPRENLVGTEGAGYSQLLDWFTVGRNYVGPIALGIAQGAYDLALEYAKEREAFGERISNYQAIRHKLADMATDIKASRMLCYQSALLQDEGEMSLELASMAKLKSSEVAEKAASESMQIHGGYGYSKEFAIERYYRAAKVTQIVEGTSEIQRNLIADQIL